MHRDILAFPCLYHEVTQLQKGHLLAVIDGCIGEGKAEVGKKTFCLVNVVCWNSNVLDTGTIICQFGISKFPKKLVISPLFCNLMVENQQLTNIYSDDYH